MRLKTLLITLLGTLVLVGAGCADSGSVTDGPFRKVTRDDPFIRFEVSRTAKPEEFFDESKLPLTLEDYYKKDFEKELGAPVNTYRDDDNDQVREYKMSGGRIKATETDGDKYGIVAYLPDNLSVQEFLIPELVQEIDTSKSYYVIVVKTVSDDVLMVIEAQGTKVTSVIL